MTRRKVVWRVKLNPFSVALYLYRKVFLASYNGNERIHTPNLQ